MSDDLIHLTLSRDDAEVLSEAVRYSEELDEATADRLLAIITAALAAPAEGPERAATGEALPGLDIIAHPAIPEGTIIAVTDVLIDRAAKALHANARYVDRVQSHWAEYREDARIVLAAVGGGGE